MENISSSILKFLKLDTVIQNLTGFVEARIELTKIEIREDVAKAVARGLMIALIFLVAFLFLVFFSVGLAQFLNQFFYYGYVGYWIVAGLYGATFLTLIALRKNIYQYFEKQMKAVMKRKEK
jgi:hypothetical protein